MRKVVAKTYSVEKIADIYLAALAKDAIQDKNCLLPDVLRKQKIYFDEGIIAGTIELLEGRKYIEGKGNVFSYTVFKPSNEAKEIIISVMIDYIESEPTNVDFTLMLKHHKITPAGIRFVRLGQILDIQGKSEREAERKKWIERINFGYCTRHNPVDNDSEIAIF